MTTSSSLALPKKSLIRRILGNHANPAIALWDRNKAISRCSCVKRKLIGAPLVSRSVVVDWPHKALNVPKPARSTTEL